jgi:hypothetical protein
MEDLLVTVSLDIYEIFTKYVNTTRRHMKTVQTEFHQNQSNRIGADTWPRRQT